MDQQAIYKGDAEIPGIAVIPATALVAPVRIDAGFYLEGQADSSGNAWRADIGYCQSKNIIPSKQVLAASSAAISGSKSPRVFQSVRLSPAAYYLPIANGSYTVNLLFAEIDKDVTAAGSRVFSVRVNDKQLPDIDIFKDAGGANKALVKTVEVTVADSMLNIVFTVGKGEPIIAGIEVLSAGANGAARPTSLLRGGPGSARTGMKNRSYSMRGQVMPDRGRKAVSGLVRRLTEWKTAER